MHTGIEGALGIGTDNRPWMFCHPNSAAPICGIGTVLGVYRFFTSRYKRLRFVLLIPFVLCMFALALTDSRAGILATTLALGLEVFFILSARCFRASKRLLGISLRDYGGKARNAFLANSLRIQIMKRTGAATLPSKAQSF